MNLKCPPHAHAFKVWFLIGDTIYEGGITLEMCDYAGRLYIPAMAGLLAALGFFFFLSPFFIPLLPPYQSSRRKKQDRRERGRRYY